MPWRRMRTRNHVSRIQFADAGASKSRIHARPLNSSTSSPWSARRAPRRFQSARARLRGRHRSYAQPQNQCRRLRCAGSRAQPSGLQKFIQGISSTRQRTSQRRSQVDMCDFFAAARTPSSPEKTCPAADSSCSFLKHIAQGGLAMARLADLEIEHLASSSPCCSRKCCAPARDRRIFLQPRIQTPTVPPTA